MVKLSLEKVSKSFGKTEVLKDISLDIDNGGILGLLGPSGCGKTTTLLTIMGVYKHDKGHIMLDDVCIDNVPRQYRGILLVPQSLHQFWIMMYEKFIGFIPGLTVFENVRDVLGLKEGEKWLKVFDLDGVKTQSPQYLSWGQQQRLALIRMLALKPKVLLLDEPLGSVDRKLKIKLNSYIQKYLKKNRITTIYVTQNIDDAKVFCDRVAVMKKGRINRIMQPDQL